MPRFAISDIHGCNATFRHMTGHELKLQPGDTLYLLGDYIDRGPGSKEVIDHILDLRNGGVNVRTLKGNHEDMMLLAIKNKGESLEHWLRNGGNTTLKSFGLDSIEEISTLSESSFANRYIDFFNNLEYYIRTEDFYFVHAGLNFSAPDPLADLHSMLWVRNSSPDESFLQHRKLIHGHTPRTIERITESIASKMIDIDGGCVYKGTHGLGHMVALNLDTMEVNYIFCMD
jgi:serine/threonine protein phosphatase 1